MAMFCLVKVQSDYVFQSFFSIIMFFTFNLCSSPGSVGHAFAVCQNCCTKNTSISSFGSLWSPVHSFEERPNLTSDP